MPLPQRLLRVVPVVLVAGLVCWAAGRNNDDYCGTVGECLGLSLDDLVTLVVAVPVGALLLHLLRVPRVALHTLTALLTGGMLWYAAGELLHAVDPDRPYDALTPLPGAVAVTVLAGVAAAYVSGPGGGRLPRVAVVAGVVVVTVGAATASGLATRADEIADIEAAPVTLYAPRVAGEGPTGGYASGDGVRLSYSVEVDGQHAFLSVELVPTPAGSLCEHVVTYAGPGCTEHGDTMRNPGEVLSDVAVVRGDTTLVAQIDEALAPDEVVTALRDAPVVTASQLAG